MVHSETKGSLKTCILPLYIADLSRKGRKFLNGKFYRRGKKMFKYFIGIIPLFVKVVFPYIVLYVPTILYHGDMEIRRFITINFVKDKIIQL